MKTIHTKLALLVFAAMTIFACNKSDDNDDATVTKKQVIENYAKIAFANYQKAYDDAVVLETAINVFLTTPTEANFTAAKTAWKTSRESYGTTEGFRFANGPIDNEDPKFAEGPEGFVNSWPLDENFIDYTDGASTSGIINDPTGFPSITKDVLVGENGKGDNEKYVTVGYHAIEFLLWGQDLTLPSANKPGQRPYTDYLTTGGTAANQARRATYLKVVADLLTDHLLEVVNQWKVGGIYRTAFLALNEDVAIKNMYLGITTLVSAELPDERMISALGKMDQEEEHSCFSDNTHRDIALNLQSVINIYKGNYGSVDGASLEDLVKQANAEFYNATEVSITSSLTKVAAILTPFDLAISGGSDSVEGKKVDAAVTELKTLGANLLAGATKIGIIVNS
jgi:putative iron-regulated protein